MIGITYVFYLHFTSVPIQSFSNPEFTPHTIFADTFVMFLKKKRSEEPTSVEKMAAGQHQFVNKEISVSIIGLTGISMENKSKKSKSSNIKTKISASSSSLSYEGEADVPVKAVVSFSKNVNSSQTLIASHVPSLPLTHLDHGNNSNKRFEASWPDDDLSTLQFTRMMQVDSASDYYHPNQRMIMIPERIKLTVGLTRGIEMITLGSANIVITGDEAPNMQVNVPISVDKSKKGAKSVSFEQDKKKFYTLQELSCLKIVLNVRDKQTQRQQHQGTNFNQIPDVMYLGSNSISRSGSYSYDGDDIPKFTHSFHPPTTKLYPGPSKPLQNIINSQVYETYDFQRPRRHVHGSIPEEESTIGEATADDTLNTAGTDDSTVFYNTKEMKRIMKRMFTRDNVKASIRRMSERFNCDTLCASLPDVPPNRRCAMVDGAYESDEEQTMSYEEYKKKMMKKKSKEPKKRERSRSRSDFSVMTEKAANTGNTFTV